MKRKLTMEDHLQLARHLRRIAAEVSAIRELIAGYGLVSSVGRRVFAAEKQLRELKSTLDGLMFRQHPTDPNANPDVYYGHAEKRERV